jgi:hypothetical protein
MSHACLDTNLQLAARSTSDSGRAKLGLTMLHCTRLPHLADAKPAALVPPVEEETSSALPTHAENELSAFEASSRRRKAVNNKLVALGTGNCCRSWLVVSPVWFSVDFELVFASSLSRRREQLASRMWPTACLRAILCIHSRIACFCLFQ